MTGSIYQYVYAALALIGAAILTARSVTPHKFVTVILSFWILGGEIIHPPTFDIPIEALGGELQIGRVLVLMLLGYLFITTITRWQTRESTKRLPYEKYLYLFFFCSLIVQFHHYFGGVVTSRELVRFVDDTLRTLVAYIVLKRDADADMINTLGKALIIVGVVSSVAAIIQFFISPYFLRIGPGRVAFGGFLRSDGVYTEEYTHSYFVLTAMIATLFGVKSFKHRAFLIPLLLIGMVLTFHRMSWFIACAVVFLSMVIERREMLWRIGLVGSLVLVSVFVIAAEVYPVYEKIERSSFFESRIAEDTWTNRLKLYSMVIDQAGETFFWGVGSKNTGAYYHAMSGIGMDRLWARGERGGIHNLYLEILFMTGGPLLIMFCVMLSSMTLYFGRLAAHKVHLYSFSFLVIVAYWLMNLTNSFPLNNSTYGILFAIVLGCSAASLDRNLEESIEIAEGGK